MTSETAERPEVDQLKEQLLRLAADFDNYKKRERRERAAFDRDALADFATALLPVLDDLDRALAQAAAHRDGPAAAAAIVEGVHLVRGAFAAVLGRFGVAPFSTVGARFDPNEAEAVVVRASDDADDVVVEELQRGWRLHDRLLRPARVVVAQRASAGEAP